MALRHSFKRYAWTILAVTVLAVGGSLYVRHGLSPSVIALPAKDIGQIMFSPTDPADGWMIASPRKTPMLYRSTNGGSDWHRVPQRIPNLAQILGMTGTKTWVLLRTARHDPALVYFPTMESTGTVERIRATARTTLPWSSFDDFYMPQQPSSTRWILAESVWNPGTGMFTVFHWNTKRSRWTTVAPVPLGVRGDAYPGIAVTGPNTLWWSSGGNGGSLAQLDRVTIGHHHAKIQAATLPGLPMHSPCSPKRSVLTDMRFGVPAFSGQHGRVMVSWSGCGTIVHLRTWTTTNGGQNWQPARPMPRGAADGMWASLSVGYAWSLGHHHLWMTIDGGTQWVATSWPSTMQIQPRSLDVVTPHNVWAMASHGTDTIVLHSADAGIHWTPVRRVDLVR